MIEVPVHHTLEHVIDVIYWNLTNNIRISLSKEIILIFTPPKIKVIDQTILKINIQWTVVMISQGADKSGKQSRIFIRLVVVTISVRIYNFKELAWNDWEYIYPKK